MDRKPEEPPRCERCQSVIDHHPGSALICDACYEQSNSCCGEWLDDESPQE